MCCSLFAVCCALSDVGCLMGVVCCSLVAVGCLLFVVLYIGRCFLSIVRRPLLAVCGLLVAVCCSLFDTVVRYVLRVVRYLFVASCLMIAVHV